jgi:hypothetical protein
MDGDRKRFSPVRAQTARVTENEVRLLQDVAQCNDHPEGFRSYVVMGTGSKGSNFGKIALGKRAASLVRKGHLSGTPYGYEITTSGRALLAAENDKKQDQG